MKTNEERAMKIVEQCRRATQGQMFNVIFAALEEKDRECQMLHDAPAINANINRKLVEENDPISPPVAGDLPPPGGE